MFIVQSNQIFVLPQNKNSKFDQNTSEKTRGFYLRIFGFGYRFPHFLKRILSFQPCHTSCKRQYTGLLCGKVGFPSLEVRWYLPTPSIRFQV